MAKWQNDSMLDAALNYINSDTGANILCLCSDQPATVAECTATYALGTIAIGTANMTTEDGDSSGRKITVAAMSNIDISASGTVNHLALCNAGTLFYVTTVTDQAVTSGNTATAATWDIEIADAA